MNHMKILFRTLLFRLTLLSLSIIQGGNYSASILRKACSNNEQARDE